MCDCKRETQDLQSLGHAAATYQLHPSIIETCLEAVLAQPYLRLNGVPYFAAADIIAAMEWHVNYKAREAAREAADAARGIK